MGVGGEKLSPLSSGDGTEGRQNLTLVSPWRGQVHGTRQVHGAGLIRQRDTAEQSKHPCGA